jgi:hypothetical protein
MIKRNHVKSAWCEVGLDSVISILTQVRSRLLDFLLDLQGKVGENMTEEEVRRAAQSPEIGAVFTQSVFGSHNTIVIGHNNRQTVIHVTAGDFDSLAKVLSEHGVQAADIAQLWRAIDADKNGGGVRPKNGLGTEVRKWIGGMVQKAADTSWAIELGVRQSANGRS